MPSSLNGTGVTFNDATTLQSGNIPAANLGSGTANSSVFLRGDKVWATVPAAAPSTADVLNATAGASVGAVGTYAWLGETVSVTTAPDGTRAGSSLRYAGLLKAQSWSANAEEDPRSSILGYTTGPAGTWRCMGHARHSALEFSGFPVTLWLRIS